MIFNITEDLIPVNHFSRPGIINQKVSGIVIHWTANTDRGADAQRNRDYFANLSLQNLNLPEPTYASAHYVVDDHSIYRAIPEREMAYHVGAPAYNQQTLRLLDTTYPNDCTIGIEWCVNAGNNFDETWDRVGWLTADLCTRYHLDPMVHLIRHYDVTWKDCPHFFTPNVPNGAEGWHLFRQYVKLLMEGQVTTTHVTEKQLESTAPLTVPKTVSPTPKDKYFTDIEGHWAQKDIDHLAELKIIKPGGLFRPNELITRAETAALLSRLLTLLGK